MTSRTDTEIYIRLRQLKLPEKTSRHPRVVVLASVDQRLVDSVLCQRCDDRRGLGEVRTRAGYVYNRVCHGNLSDQYASLVWCQTPGRPVPREAELR